MEELFNDIEGCDVIVDDLIVCGRNEEEHDQRLMNVLDRAREVQLRLNKNKCKIPCGRSSVYRLHPDLERLKAR
jgi:hypothetical protein